MNINGKGPLRGARVNVMSMGGGRGRGKDEPKKRKYGFLPVGSLKRSKK
jgi:hypothetical protein